MSWGRDLITRGRRVRLIAVNHLAVKLHGRVSGNHWPDAAHGTSAWHQRDYPRHILPPPTARVCAGWRRVHRANAVFGERGAARDALPPRRTRSDWRRAVPRPRMQSRVTQVHRPWLSYPSRLPEGRYWNDIRTACTVVGRSSLRIYLHT